MKYTESQFVRMSKSEKAQLLALAQQQERTPSDVVRRLIRRAAQESNQSNDLTVSNSAPEVQNGTSNPR